MACLGSTLKKPSYPSSHILHVEEDAQSTSSSENDSLFEKNVEEGKDSSPEQRPHRSSLSSARKGVKQILRKVGAPFSHMTS